MMISSNPIAAGVRLSLADLSTEGVDLVGLPEQQVRALVHQHLDYFQMMVGPGCPAEEDDILTAVLTERRQLPPAGVPFNRLCAGSFQDQ